MSSWGPYEAVLEERTRKTQKSRLIERLREKDPSLWKKTPADQAGIRDRLGWLDAPRLAKSRAREWISFAEEIKNEGFAHAMLLGMGGSSLAPEVFQRIFGNKKGFPELVVLDSTDPARILGLEGRVELSKTLFVVSSKSGGTVEVVSLYKYFFEKIKSNRPDPGRQFIAITDPDTALARLARENHFRKIFLAPPDVGGRFSALTAFGLVPAALIGVELEKIWAGADGRIDEGPAIKLGISMAVLAEEGRDKLTLLLPKPFEAFGDWVEQLVAESTGKEETGIVPVVGESPEDPGFYGADRFFVSYLPQNEKTKALEKAGHPVFYLPWDDARALGAEFFRWEVATAVAGSLLKINPFDQPDVQSAKDRTRALLKRAEAGEKLSIPAPGGTPESFWKGRGPGGYAAILAFLPGSENVKKKLARLGREIRKATKMAVTIGIGPRYLHSTGQLHKGGPNKGIFLLITAGGSPDLAIPGEKYGFADLELAQALGDLEALEEKGRSVYSVRLKEISDAALDDLTEKVKEALK
ncbi:MAG: glucose-6-phosphate isomerase [Candidatus Omnitrophica bacterium]|nr:glucose-6-phosphate isomerase [Candidatus Omnitrophota bacterium]